MPTLSTKMPEESHFESLHPFTVRGRLRTADCREFQTGTAHQWKDLLQLSRQWIGRLVSNWMDMGWSRCLRRKQYLTPGTGKVSAHKLVQEGAGSYHSTNREVLKQCPRTDLSESRALCLIQSSEVTVSRAHPD